MYKKIEENKGYSINLTEGKKGEKTSQERKR